MKNRVIQNWGLHWFRRDLRIPGNKALRHNWKQSDRRTLGLFCFDSQFLSREDFSHNRFAFFLKTLAELKKELRSQGGDLLIVDELPLIAFAKLFDHFKSQGVQPPARITWNRDYEPFARRRDEAVEQELKKLGAEVQVFRDHLVFEPHEIQKDETPGSYYQVYSPFARKWFSLLNAQEGQDRLQEQNNWSSYISHLQKSTLQNIFDLTWEDFLRQPNFPYQDSWQKFYEANQKSVTISIPEAGTLRAFEACQLFSPKIEKYKTDRDFPTLNATSKLSMFFKNGSATATQVLPLLKTSDFEFKKDSGPIQFVKEIAWREFYYHILYHRPDVEQSAFLKKYQSLKWNENKDWFQRWKDGMTGFPIVDAGLRELNTTGWMHNRVRMIVASFLTKDLLLPWTWGENYFMKMLLDGDLACNNGGWQWAASTGCDPQPYFRVFNPWLQGAKFDPDAIYIKKYVPELARASAQEIHAQDADLHRYKYPKPMVDHFVQKQKAIDHMKNIGSASFDH